MNPSELREAHDKHLAKYLTGSMTEDELFDANVDAVIASLPKQSQGDFDEFEQGWNGYYENVLELLQSAKSNKGAE